VEHELCPVVVAAVDGELTPDPDEVDAYRWLPWPAVVARARDDPGSLSPWSVRQIDRFEARRPPATLLRVGDPADSRLDAVPGRDRRAPVGADVVAADLRAAVAGHLRAFLRSPCRRRR
jgi:hypothetical protein